MVIFECLDYHTDKTFPNPMEVINHFKDGLGKYRKQEWDKAKAAFGEALKAHTGDKLSKIYNERCEYFQKNSPGEKWDGVWVMKEKQVYRLPATGGRLVRGLVISSLVMKGVQKLPP